MMLAPRGISSRVVRSTFSLKFFGFLQRRRWKFHMAGNNVSKSA